ncbi:hypothetical protein [Crocosphaera sp.]|uniref:hypothetical protein n=1 Tax=Crocosphaera sp. TaxID=2729996 RepID=UPI00261D1F08|nr:hypothetical protein [Crocosphaera sp.]MDJ0581697.1 hypothetical protein [Crocosphaera sp.]
MEWQEFDPKEIESMDEFIENYKKWKIYFCIPNGGILAVSVSNGKIAYSYLSELEFLEQGIDRYCDSEWHLQKAKTFIDSMKKTSVRKKKRSIKKSFFQLEINLFDD